MPSTEILKNLKYNKPGALDGNWGPYDTVEQACLAIPDTEPLVDGQPVKMRLGKVVGIITPDGIVDYWWPEIYTDEGLVPKVNIQYVDEIAAGLDERVITAQATADVAQDDIEHIETVELPAKADKSDIVDNLTSGGANKMLSAEQGKNLNTGLTIAQEDIEHIETVQIPLKANKADIIDNLTAGGTTKMLSAEQGKTLQTNKAEKSDIVNNLTSGGTAKMLSAEQGKLLKGSVDGVQGNLTTLETITLPATYLNKTTDLQTYAPARAGLQSIIGGLTQLGGYLDASGNFVVNLNWITIDNIIDFTIGQTVTWYGRRGSGATTMRNLIAVDGGGAKTYLISSNTASANETIVSPPIPAGTVKLMACFNGLVDYALSKPITFPEVPDGQITVATKKLFNEMKVEASLNPIFLNNTSLSFTYFNGLQLENAEIDIAPAILKLLGTPLAKPSPFASIPFEIFKQNGNFFTTVNVSDYDFEIETSAKYYFSPDGSDSNSGSNPNYPKKSIKGVIEYLNANLPAGGATFYLIGKQGKRFTYEDLGGTVINFNLVVKGVNKPILTNEVTSATFKRQGTTNCYYCQLGFNTTAPIDLTYRRPNGDLKRLTLATSLAACETTPGTFFYSTGSTCYFHLFDSRAPDSNVLPLRYAPIFHINADKFFCSNVEVWGSAIQVPNNIGVFNISRTSGNAKKYMITNTKIVLGMESVSVRTNGNTISVLNNLYCTGSAEDNIGYYGYNDLAVTGCMAIEINCKSYFGGYNNDGSNNGTTLHNGWNALRINGDYSFNENKNVADIAGAKVWMLGCKVSNATSPTVNVNYSFSGGCEVWFDSCFSGGSITDLELVGSSNIIHFKDAVPPWTQVGTGTVGIY